MGVNFSAASYIEDMKTTKLGWGKGWSTVRKMVTYPPYIINNNRNHTSNFPCIMFK